MQTCFINNNATTLGTLSIIMPCVFEDNIDFIHFLVTAPKIDIFLVCLPYITTDK